MPAPKIDRLVIPVPDFSAHIDFGVAYHTAPAELPRFWVACDELLVLSYSNARRVPTAHHHRLTTFSHHLRADMGFAATSPAKRLVAQNHTFFVIHAGFQNKEPLALPDRLASLDLCWQPAGNCG